MELQSQNYKKGAELYTQGKYEESIEIFNKEIETNPKSTQCYNGKGLALLKLNQNDEALKCYELAIESDKKNAEAYFNKAVILGIQEKFEDALKCNEEALSKDKDNIQFLFNKARLQLLLKKAEPALTDFEKGLDLFKKKKFSETISQADKKYLEQYVAKYEKNMGMLQKVLTLLGKKAKTADEKKKLTKASEMLEKAFKSISIKQFQEDLYGAYMPQKKKDENSKDENSVEGRGDSKATTDKGGQQKKIDTKSLSKIYDQAKSQQKSGKKPSFPSRDEIISNIPGYDPNDENSEYLNKFLDMYEKLTKGLGSLMTGGGSDRSTCACTIF